MGKKKFNSRQKGAVKRLKDYLRNLKCLAGDVDEEMRNPDVVAGIQEDRRWAVLSVSAPVFDSINICSEKEARDFIEQTPGSYFRVVDLYSPRGEIEVLFDRQKKFTPRWFDK